MSYTCQRRLQRPSVFISCRLWARPTGYHCINSSSSSSANSNTALGSPSRAASSVPNYFSCSCCCIKLHTHTLFNMTVCIRYVYASLLYVLAITTGTVYGCTTVYCLVWRMNCIARFTMFLVDITLRPVHKEAFKTD